MQLRSCTTHYLALRGGVLRCAEKECPACTLEEEAQTGRPRGPARPKGVGRAGGGKAADVIRAEDPTPTKLIPCHFALR
jgi:hypothetical protein